MATIETAGTWTCTPDEYHADHSAIGCSMLKCFRKSPALYNALYVAQTLPKQEPTPDMRIGTWTHTATLQPAEWAATHVVAPRCDRRTREGKAMWADFCEAADGKTAVDAEDAALVAAMSAACWAHPLARQLLTADGAVEQAIRWTDPQSGLTLKARPDKLIRPGPQWQYPVVVDLKTTVDPSPDGFPRQAVNLGYHLQAAMYLEAARQLCGLTGLFIFVAVGKEQPHDVWVHRLDNDFLALGIRDLQDTILRLARAYKFDQWQADGQLTLSTISAPRWALRDNV